MNLLFITLDGARLDSILNSPKIDDNKLSKYDDKKIEVELKKMGYI